MDANNRICRLGITAQACAIGQAAAAIFADAAVGRTGDEIVEAKDEISNWLRGGSLPAWPGFEAISAAQGYPARHGAVTLAWEAASQLLGVPLAAR